MSELMEEFSDLFILLTSQETKRISIEKYGAGNTPALFVHRRTKNE